MVNCIKCFLHSSIRVVNLVVILFGISMIIYSLWLLKRWNAGFAELYSVSALPTPWFIYSCTGVGIVVCLSMLGGHVVANCMSFTTLFTYIVAVCCILSLQAGLIVGIFFKMDWDATVAKYIGMNYEEFKKFLHFHITLCRLITLIILFAQISALMPAVVLLTVGPVPRNHCSSSDNEPEFKQSFLVRSDSPILLPN